MAVPDWPLSFGTLFPRMAGGVLFEHGHRLVAGATALLSIGLTASILRSPVSRALRRLASAATLGILAQALLGGLTVLLKLPPAVSILHACLGQAVFCALLAIAELTGSGVRGPGSARNPHPAPLTPTLWRYGALAVAATYLQLILGAWVRHTGHGVLLHILWAFGVTAHVGSVAVRTFRSAPGVAALTRPAALLAAAVAVQLALGLAVYALRAATPWHAGFDRGALLATAHVAVGALILGASLVWTLRAFRFTQGLRAKG